MSSADTANTTPIATAFERMCRAVRGGNLDAFMEAIASYNGEPAQLVATVDGSGSTLVHLAAQYANPALLEMLVTMDPSLNIKALVNKPEQTAERNTPLHLAANPRVHDEPSALECVQLLLSKGANAKARNAAGDRPGDDSPFAKVRAVIRQQAAVSASDLAADEDASSDDE
ncbi:hypothetical protein BCR44DRAFT_63314 [Catenaria anguillulae PL171]|uniref:Uncharacterized protein n=1 Tax=Catenaria anguillulae PL171 TaxID=765915 RepID=A0A1Y2HPD9_9FUNG|nr:hypothetical protein BCR44DRAFT_63314 [Catenaria anguillulae PL171]